MCCVAIHHVSHAVFYSRLKTLLFTNPSTNPPGIRQNVCLNGLRRFAVIYVYFWLIYTSSCLRNQLFDLFRQSGEF